MYCIREKVAWGALSTFSKIILDVPSGGHDLLLALHGAQQHALHAHEALAHKALGAAGALEALGFGVPVVLSVRHTLSLRLDGVLTGRTTHSVVLHVAGFANRLLILHDVGFSSQHTVTVKTAEVLQVPIVALSLGVLIIEDELIASRTSRLLAVSIMAATVQLTLLPEIDHVHQ